MYGMCGFDRRGVRQKILVSQRQADKRAIHGKPQKGHYIRVTCLGQLAVLSDVRQVQCRHVCCLPQRVAEAFWKPY